MSTFLVFGRRSHTTPLQLQARLEAPEDDAAREALQTHGWDWLELTLVPEAAVTRVPQTRRRHGSEDG
jgi:hypothetical protein